MEEPSSVSSVSVPQPQVKVPTPCNSFMKPGKPSHDELEELGEEIADKWIKLGRRLGIDDSTLKEIDHAHGQLSEKGYHMLKHWLQAKGSDATYQALYNALTHKLVNRKDLAEQYCYSNIGTSAGAVPGATAITYDSRASKYQEDGSCVTGCHKRKRLNPDPEQGNLPFTIGCANATGRHSEGPREARTEKVNQYMRKKVDEAKGKFDLSSLEGLYDLHVHLVGHLHLVDVSYHSSSIIINVKCRTLEILEGLWQDYRSGHLNSVAEECLITEKVKEELDMETITLETTILEEDYLTCKLSLMEITGEAFLANDGQSEPRRELESREHMLQHRRELAAFAEEELTEVGREHDFSEDVPELTLERLKSLRELQKTEKKSSKLKSPLAVYTQEQLNYFKMAFIVTNVLAQGLRLIFKQEWDSRYQATLGEWKDTRQNGQDFYNGESPGNRKRHARLLATMINGNRAEWDLTMLFYAILRSNSIHELNTTVRESVNNLKEFRDRDFAHNARAQLSDPEFRIAIRKVEVAFQALGLSTKEIHDVSKQKDFLAEELQNTMKEVQTIYQELQVPDVNLQMLEKQRQWQDWQQRDASSFCFLPPTSSNIVSREGEVGTIIHKLEKLRIANENGLSYMYIVGTPGSGKTQMALMVARRFYDKAVMDSSAPSFVMYLNAKSTSTLLESYIEMARQVQCPEFVVTNTRNSKEMTIRDIINNFRDLIATKISFYRSWLLVVDNVTSVSLIREFLPQPGNEQWIKGQLLITTRDTLSIPSESSFVSHINISKGMEPLDASSLLAMLSDIKDQEMEETVAKALEYQPLVLATAGMYVKQIRESGARSKFGWKDYLEELKEGKISTSSSKQHTVPADPSYFTTTKSATRIPVEIVIRSSKVMKHTFTLLTLCASLPLNLDIVISYILSLDKGEDKTKIITQIKKCSLLQLQEDENGVHIHLHNIEYEAAKSVAQNSLTNDEQHLALYTAVKSFSQVIGEKQAVRDTKHLVPHLRTLILGIENILSSKETCQAFINSVPVTSRSPVYFQRLGKICEDHGDFLSAKGYYDVALKFIENSEVYGEMDLAVASSLLGGVHRTLGDLELAKEYFERSLAMLLKKLGREDVDVARSYTTLGAVLKDLGHLQQAKEYFDRALAIQLKKLGPEHVDVARTYGNLAALLQDLGELEQAKEYFERALSIRLKTLGPEHADVASTYNNLGTAQHVLGNLQQAKEQFEHALSIRQRLLGPDHVDVARTYINLGAIHQDSGNLEQAKELYERALDKLQKHLGFKHIDVARTHLKLGAVQRQLSDLPMAKEHFERALNVNLEMLGPEHFDVGLTYYELGGLEWELDHLDKAKEDFELAVVIFGKTMGPDHHDVAAIHNDLGAIHQKLGHLKLAKEYLTCALLNLQKILGPEDVDVAITPKNLGSLYRKLGELELAMDHFERALQILLKTEPGHVDVAIIHSYLYLVYRKLGDQEQAKVHFQCASLFLQKKI